MNTKVEKKYGIALHTITDNAQANAKHPNVVKAVVSVDGIPAANERVICQVDGGAYFEHHGINLISLYTNAEGAVSVNILNNFPESNTASFYVKGDKPGLVSTTVNFVAIRERFVISSIKTKNKTLFVGEPSIFWENASFTITTAGGSGSVTWGFEGEDEGLALTVNEFGDVQITAIAPFVGQRTLIAVDNITQEVVSHSFRANYFLEISPNQVPLQKILVQGDSHLLGRSLIYVLFEQWGNLSEYNGWNGSVNYWTNEHNEVSDNTAIAFNPVTANYIKVAVIENDTPVELGYAFITKKLL